MEIGKFQPPQNRYPWTDQQKVGTVDYVHERTPYSKFNTNPPTEGFWANGWNITKNYFYLYLFSQVRVQVRPVDGFLRATAQKTWNHARMCFLGVWSSELWTMSRKFWGKPPKLKFWDVNRTFKPERQKIQILITWKLLSWLRRNV